MGNSQPKLAITSPWEVLCVDLIGPYTLGGKDRTEVSFMCLTMIDPASSWFKIIELQVVENAPTPHTKGKKGEKHMLKLRNHTSTNL